MGQPPQQIYDALDRAYFSDDPHEKRELAQLPRLLAATPLFVDVGASLGQYTLHASRALRGARLLAIEADPIRFARLKENCATWAAASGNDITAVFAAAADQAGTLTFQSTQSDVSGGVFTRNVPGREVTWEPVSVPAITLDELLAGHDEGVIKIDVEGSEWRVLRGARRLLERGGFRFIVEVHSWGDPALGKTPADVFALFAEAGYRSERLHHHHLFVRDPLWRRLLGRPRRRLAAAARSARSAARALRQRPPRELAQQARWAAAARGLIVTDNERRLRELRDRHRGERVWVIGNGPSLRGMDLTRLGGDASIASNGIFLLYPDTSFRPRYYTVEDVLVAEDRAKEINALADSTKIIPLDVRRWIEPTPNTIYLNFARAYAGFPRFSEDLLRRAYWGGTVTFLNLQLAYYLGAKEICLIGVDHNYAPPAAADQLQGHVITSATADQNHFHPSYFGPGYRWHTPMVERMEVGYREARRFLDERGVRVLNATAGGKLEVFDRRTFESLTRA